MIGERERERESKLGRACLFAFPQPLTQAGQNVCLSWHLTLTQSTCIGVVSGAYTLEALLFITIYIIMDMITIVLPGGGSSGV